MYQTYQQHILNISRYNLIIITDIVGKIIVKLNHHSFPPNNVNSHTWRICHASCPRIWCYLDDKNNLKIFYLRQKMWTFEVSIFKLSLLTNSNSHVWQWIRKNWVNIYSKISYTCSTIIVNLTTTVSRRLKSFLKGVMDAKQNAQIGFEKLVHAHYILEILYKLLLFLYGVISVSVLKYLWSDIYSRRQYENSICHKCSPISTNCH